jgi:ribokinase
VGASLIDLISYVPRLPAPGETLHGTDFRTGFGGKGANQAVMAAKLGARVTMVSRVGRDAFGEGILDNFRSVGVDTAHVGVEDGAPTGVAPIAVGPGGENAIVIVTGANAAMTAAHVEAARETIAGADVLVCQLEVPLEVTMAALRIADGTRTTAILNPAPAPGELADEAYGLAGVLCPNEPEAERLLGRAIGPGEELEAASALRERGPRAVVLTLGERGCAVAADGVHELVPAEPADAVDTTGAGDAFVGSLAHLLGRGLPLAEAATRACRIAAISVRRHGTQTSFPSADELPPGLLS